MLSSAWVLMKVCGEPVSKRETQQELYGNGATVNLDFGGGKVIHRCYASNKTKSLLGEQGRVLAGLGGGHRYSGPMAYLVESRVSPTNRRLLTCHLDTTAVA